jgi:protease PrsW
MVEQPGTIPTSVSGLPVEGVLGPVDQRDAIATDPTAVAPIRLSHWPAAWMTAALLTLGAVLMRWYFDAAYAPRASVTLPPLTVPAMLAVVLFGLHGLGLFLIVRSVDLTPRPPLLLFTGLAWGGLLATGLTSLAEQQLGQILIKLTPLQIDGKWVGAIEAPLIEETVKGLGVVMIVLLARPQVSSVLDGVVFGALVGVGFQEVENVLYALLSRGTDSSGRSTVLPVETFLLRGLGGGLCMHAAWTAVVGGAIGWAASRCHRPWLARIGVVLAAFVPVVALHVLWNSWLIVGSPSVLSWGLYTVAVAGSVVVITGLAIRGRRYMLTEWFGALADPRLITEAEITVVCSPLRRLDARWNSYVQFGWRGLRAVRRLQRAQGALASGTGGPLQSMPIQLVSMVAVGATGDRRVERREVITAATAIQMARDQLNLFGCPPTCSVEPSPRGTVAGWAALGLGIVGLPAVAVWLNVNAFQLLPRQDLAVASSALAAAGLVVAALCVWHARRAQRAHTRADVRLAIAAPLAIASLMVAVILLLPLFGQA